MNTATEADYFADEDAMRKAVRRLRWTSRSSVRSRQLFLLGDSEMRRAGLHSAVFGQDPHDTDGTPAPEWMADSARMLWILAEIEQCRAQRTTVPLQSQAYIDRTDHRVLELQFAVDHLLDEWVRGGDRWLLVEQMCRQVWAPITGGQAVEGPLCLGLLQRPWWAR